MYTYLKFIVEQENREQDSKKQTNSEMQFKWESIISIQHTTKFKQGKCLLLSNANEHNGSSNGNMFSRPWHDKIKCRLQLNRIRVEMILKL